jgi:serine O-acetyltransferase
MIQSKEDYHFYLKADEIALGVNNYSFFSIPYFFNKIWRFQRLLRKYEFYKNCRQSLLWKPYTVYLHFRVAMLGDKLHFEIPPNVFGPGLGIAHKGIIVIDPQMRIGENCRIHSGLYIGSQAAGKNDEIPTIGNNVYIGPFTVIVGKITIADNIAIGSHSYVARSFPEEGITIAGAPAKKVSDKGSWGLCSYQRATEILKKGT